MLKRKIINDFYNWKQQKDKKALLVKGARQTGKTTAIRNFARKYYKHFVEINFEQNPLAKQAFEGSLNADNIIMNLSVMGYGPFEKGETLIFFDEIQSCPKARTSIKFLVEDGRYDYIESGSLLGINYNDVSSYPVGYEHQLDMYPLDFEEFLWACNVSSELISNVQEHYDNLIPLPPFIHEQLLNRLNQYFFIGGMPEVVNTFVNDKDFSKTLSIQRDIVNSYRDDISKYAGKDKLLAKSIFDALPQQLSKENKRFILADIEQGASQRKFASPTEWLTDAGIAYFSFNVNNLELPLSFYTKRNLYKLYLIDNGLMCSMITGQNSLQVELLHGNLSINQGAFAENYVASELSKKGILLNYYDKKSRQELDFVYPKENKVNILEVKSGKDYKKHSALNKTMEQHADNINQAIVLSKSNIEIDNKIIYLPLYMTMFL